MSEEEKRLNGITERVIGAAYRIREGLGSGFLEGVYKRAFLIELAEMGLRAEEEHPLPVFYKGQQIGLYYADILVEGCVIIELKAGAAIAKEHVAQCLHYLAATKFPVCLLINFGRTVTVQRLVGESFPKGDREIRND